MSATETKELAIQLLNGNLFQLKHLIDRLQPEELAAVLNTAKEADLHKIFQLLPPEKAIRTFENLEYDTQEDLLNKFSFSQLSNTLNQIAPDDRTQLFERLNPETVQRYVSVLNDEERRVAQSLLKYPEESIGRLMTTDFISVKEDWTVQQALEYIRAYGKQSETLNEIYVTDNRGVLIDDINVGKFLLAPLDQKVSTLMDRQFVSLSAKDDQEKAVRVFKETNRVAVPVTDFNGLLLGIITVDDVVDVMEEEDTEDIQKFGGSEALDEPYLKVSLRKLIQKRAGWLVVLFVGEMFTASAMGYFTNEIQKAVVLMLFVPLIISSGGNSGSQAATLIIRAMALGEVTLVNWWKVIRREFLSGLVLGLILGFIGFLRITLWTIFTNLYGPHWFLLAITVSISLVGVVMWGTLSGSLLPLVLKRLGADPAASSAPFIATLVDVTGLVIYFSVAFLILKGTLL
ncbi:MAG TPA: magnesium transporter [Chitinophagales bacterium]|nr:magnesium transporter [Chitinophagales bacterium]